MSEKENYSKNLEKDTNEQADAAQKVAIDMLESDALETEMTPEHREKWQKRRQDEQWAYEDGMSYEQAENKIKEFEEEVLKKPVKIDKDAINFQPSSEAAEKFVKYAVSLLPSTERGLLYGSVLLMRVHGCPYWFIAKELSLTPEKVMILEAEAKKAVQDVIVKTKNQKIPIIGGLR